MDERIHDHNLLMDKYNRTGKSPMELSSTPEGQLILNKINEKVAHDYVQWKKQMEGEVIL